MSSPEELTFVIGRWLQPIIFVLDVVRRIRPAPRSSREQQRTAPNDRFGRGSFWPRSEA
ncbi:hypothetical protein [Bradyrhizobium sp.]|uniref:hypothetical protein n=1 Tax=Bradyrhizobium sp. TaxID=376 RepID=UPI003BB1C7BD